MNSFIEKRVLRRLEKQGFILQKAVAKEQVIKLIERLHPVQTQFELIRLGSNKDGGYLVPDCVDDIIACFSPGVAKVSEFERDCLQRDMKIFMADKSVEKPNWDVSEDRYEFQKKFIGCTNNQEFMTLDNWVQSTNLSNKAELLLQMDIEGGEYATIMNAPDELMKRFKIMVIEFHRLKQLWNKGFFELAETVFKKILQTHVCVHLHPNNFGGTERSVYSKFGLDIPKVMEFSFIRKDIVEVKGFQSQFPHPLDFDNTKKAHYSLPKAWYKG
jgi:hypothetical protein